MTTALKEQFDELITEWMASRDGQDKVTVADFDMLLHGIVAFMAEFSMRQMLRVGMTMDQAKAEMTMTYFPVLQQRKAEVLAQFRAFMDTPNAPSHSMN